MPTCKFKSSGVAKHLSTSRRREFQVECAAFPAARELVSSAAGRDLQPGGRQFAGAGTAGAAPPARAGSPSPPPPPVAGRRGRAPVARRTEMRLQTLVADGAREVPSIAPLGKKRGRDPCFRGPVPFFL